MASTRTIVHGPFDIYIWGQADRLYVRPTFSWTLLCLPARTSARMRILFAALLMGSTMFAQAPAQAPTKTAPQQGPPPKNLTVRPDGHASANQDPANPDTFEVHVVKQGETLSGIAGEA